MATSQKQKIKDAAKKAAKRETSVVDKAAAENASIAALCLQFYAARGENQAAVFAAVRGSADPLRFMAMLADKIVTDYGTGTLRRFLVGMARAEEASASPAA